MGIVVEMKEPRLGKVKLSAELAERLLGFLADTQGDARMPGDVAMGAAELWAWLEEEINEGGEVQ